MVTGLALVIRLLQIDRPPQFDELYHILAARSWAHDGTLALGGGAYTRAAAFTALIGVFFKVLGDGLAVARLPSILAGTLWVGAIHRGTGVRAGRLAGGLAGLFAALDPGAIYISGFARFYAIQGLLVWVGAMSLYDLIDQEPSGWRAVRSSLVIAVTWLTAVYLQITTLIALVGAGGWAAWHLLARLRRAAGRSPAGRATLVAVIVLALLGAALAVRAGIVGRLYFQYRDTPIWGEPTMNDWHYYERWFLGRYPALWLLFPLAAVTALMVPGRLAGFALAVFGAAFVLFSGGALKTERYLAFSLPFFFVVWGIALADWAPRIQGWATRIAGRLAGARTSLRARRFGSWGVVGLLAGWFVIYDPAFAMTRRMIVRDWETEAYQESDWAAAAPALRHLVDLADVVISTALPKTLYYVGRADVTLSLTELGELGRRNGKPIEFSLDPRTGRPAISSPESLERIMACYGRGLLLIEDVHWHNLVVIPASTRAFLASHTEEVPLPSAWLLHARRWTTAQPTSGPGCPPWRVARSAAPDSRNPRELE